VGDKDGLDEWEDKDGLDDVGASEGHPKVLI